MHDLAAFREDLSRWTPAPKVGEPVEVSQSAEFDTSDLQQLDRALSDCWSSLLSQEANLRDSLCAKWPWNPVFTTASLLEPLTGLAPEPILTRGLAWLLRPPGQNAIGSLQAALLGAVIHMVCGNRQPRANELQEWTTEAEYPLRVNGVGGRQRIDVLLRGVLKGKATVIGVEAKLRSGLGPNQLERYLGLLEKAFSGCSVHLVLLTPHGRSPHETRVRSVSYATLAETMTPILMRHATDPAAGFAQLLVSELVRGADAGFPNHAGVHGGLGLLNRIRAANACLGTGSQE